MSLVEQHSLLLSLPTELLIHEILCRLSVLPLLALRRTCRRFRQLIDGDNILAYQLELGIAGMIDRTSCSYQTYPVSKRLQYLLDHERYWRDLKPKWTRTVSFPIAYRASFQMSQTKIVFIGDHWVDWKNGEPFKSHLMCCKIPSSTEELLEWEEISLDSHVIVKGFGSAIRSFDICVCVTCPEIQSYLASHWYMDLHLLQYTTFGPHPLASAPVLKLLLDTNPSVHPVWKFVSLDISNEVMTVFTGVKFQDEGPWSAYIYVWDWKAGQERGVYKIPNLRIVENNPIWLTENRDTFFWANEKDHCVDLYTLLDPPSATQPHYPHDAPKILQPVHRFCLPEMHPDWRSFIVDACSFCTLPPHVNEFTQPDIPPVIDDPKKPIICLSIDYIHRDRTPGDNGHYDFDEATRYTVMIDRTPLLEYGTKSLAAYTCATPSTCPSETPEFETEVLPWRAWGPDATRWIYPKGEAWFSCSGQRVARCIAPAPDNPKQSWVDRVEVFDFSSMRIARDNYLHQVSVEKGEDSGMLKDGRKKFTYVSHSSPTNIPGDGQPFMNTVTSHLPFAMRVFDGSQHNDFLNGAEGVDWRCSGVTIEDERLTGVMENIAHPWSIDAFNIIAFN